MRRRLPLLAVPVLALMLGGSSPSARQLPPYGGAAEFRADLAARRAKTMASLGAEAIFVAWSAPERVYSTDVNYEYRQDSNLLYLTGIDQEETILVLMPGNETRKEMLFVREADARREHWNGHSLTPAEASAASGIQTVMTGNQFEPLVAALFSQRVRAVLPGALRRPREARCAPRAAVQPLRARRARGPVRGEAARALLRL